MVQVAIEALLAIVFAYISDILSLFADSLDAWLYRSGTCVIFLSVYLAILLKIDAADENCPSENVFTGLLTAAHGGWFWSFSETPFCPLWKDFGESGL